MRMSEKTRTCIVLGLGRFGEAICLRLAELGQSVIGVDRNRSRVEALSETIDLTAQLDVTDEAALEKVGVKDCDVAVVAIGESLEASVLASAILVGFKVPLVVARARNALHARVLARVGVQRVVFPERDLGLRTAEQIVHPHLSRFSEIPGSGLIVGEVGALPEMFGKTLQELDFRHQYNAVVLLVNRNGDRFLPRADTVLEDNDLLMVTGKQEDIGCWIDRCKEKVQGGETLEQNI
jgi:trk system potassium uptake protein TrkA